MSDKPAFPRNYMASGHNGLTMRELFAAMALQGLLSDPSTADCLPDKLALAALTHADALMAALMKETEDEHTLGQAGRPDDGVVPTARAGDGGEAERGRDPAASPETPASEVAGVMDGGRIRIPTEEQIEAERDVANAIVKRLLDLRSDDYLAAYAFEVRVVAGYLATARLEGWNAALDAAAHKADLHSVYVGLGDPYVEGRSDGYNDAVAEVKEAILALKETKP